MILSRRSSLIAAAAAALVLAACADQRDPIAGIPSGAADGLYPQVVIAGATSSTTEVRVSLLRKPSGTRLGSYQGELTYDATALRFERASLPEGIDGVVESAGAGRIRFLGTALDGVGDLPLVTVRFSRTGQVQPTGFAVRMEEVTTADLTDVTAQVSTGAPLVGLVDR
jgi:hypothetical protein